MEKRYGLLQNPNIYPVIRRHALKTVGQSVLSVVVQGKEGVVIVKTKQTLLITHYPDTIQPGQAATTVEKVGGYVVGAGY